MKNIAKSSKLPRKVDSIEALKIIGNDTNDEMDSDTETPQRPAPLAANKIFQ